jgi:tricorn protease-like protein
MRFPAISPDGNTIAFAYQGDIYVVPSGGGTAMPVTLNDSYDYMPVWSPDGQSIAFASDRHGNFDVFMVSVKGGDAKRLTFHSSNDSPTDFTPDGKNVVFYSSRQDLASNQQNPSGAMPEFYSVPVSGGTEKLVITTPILDARYSIDGDKIVFHVNSTGKHHGTYRRFILNNFLIEEIIYKDGLMHGHIHTFHNNGKPMVKTNFQNGKEHGHRQEWFPDGTLKYSCFYSHGKLDGEMINYYLNGKIMLKCAYIEGQISGLYQLWNSDGDLIEEK